jgi:hypothetical protein
MPCGCKYTPELKVHGYSDDGLRQNKKLFTGSMNLRRIGRHLVIHHHNVSLWVKASAARLPVALVRGEVKSAKMNELSTFIGKKTGSTPS